MTHYILPPGKTYGKGDGSSKTNAWSGFDNVVWKNIKPGDIIYILGQYYSKNSKFLPITIKCSGIKGAPITIISGPTDPVVFDHHYLSFDNCSYLLFSGLTLQNSGQIQADNATNITFDKCIMTKLDPSAIVFIELHKGNHDWVIKNGLIEFCGNAIYTHINLGDPPQRLTVSNMILRHIAVDKWLTEDGHAVGIQGGSGHIINGNKITDVGTAICCWCPASTIMNNLSITHNIISNCRALEVSMGSGIEISGSVDIKNNLPNVGWRSGSVISNNNINNVACYGISTNVRDPVCIKDNIITHYGKTAIHVWNPFLNKII